MCASLRWSTKAIEPNDVRVVGYVSGKVGAGGGAAVFDNIPAGTERLIYVAARGQSGTVVGNGCAEHVTIRIAATVNIDIVVYPLD